MTHQAITDAVRASLLLGVGTRRPKGHDSAGNAGERS